MDAYPLPRQLETLHQQAAALLVRAQEITLQSLSGWTGAEPAQTAALKHTWHQLTETMSELLTVHDAFQVQHPRYQDLLEYVPDGYLVTTAAGVIQECSEAAADLVGMPVQSLLGQKLTAFVAPDEVPAFEHSLARLAATTSSKHRETRFLNGRGAAIDSAYVVIPARDAQGSIVGLRWMIWDVTDRKHLDQALLAARQAAQHAAERAGRLQAVIEGLGEARTPRQILAVVVQQGAAALGPVTGVLNTLSADGSRLRTYAVDAPGGKPVRAREFSFSAARPAADVVRSGEPLWLASLQSFTSHFPRLGKTARRAGFRAFAVLPLRVEERLLGAVLFNFIDQHDFDAADQAFLLALGRLTAQALTRNRALRLENSALRQEMAERTRSQAENARDLAQLRTLTADLTLVREEERRRLALELHDQLGGALTALKMDVYLLRRALGNRELAISEGLGSLSDSIGGTLTLVRDLASELRPPMLDDLGLPASLEWAAGEFQTRFGIACRWVTNTDVLRLEPAPATAIFHAVQECLTNIVRHAEATEVTITLLSQPAVLVVSVRDNGKGFRYSPATHGRSVGLAGLQERIQAIGGSLVIESAPGQGTMVIMTLAPQLPA